MKYAIRDECADDVDAIRRITQAAFSLAEHSSGTESAIVDALRMADALAVSLVATMDEEVVGHIAFSPVTIGTAIGWFGLGPLSVRPDMQKQGIGGALVGEGLIRLRAMRARGCVVLGDPGYYRRFGFVHDPAIRYEGVPPEYFMRLSFDGSEVSGNVVYHEGFSAS
ncbi:GNAT family N-acetyltransferase [Oxalicibacterium solurbis]|uniref:GCN5 family N-acetyltransferase n=1 Tax=Oxalicibacterium solurbis TaxID=69280 RepID=A0A8J3B4P5_9BURK|nr:N-acetyltransferase [Oxalicibacterium solurbis]GGI54749.1 GCN5 family N-acetyltransferase [Oxalicibacterium solurbis]